MKERPEIDAGAVALNTYARMLAEMTMRAIVAEANLAACEDKLRRALKPPIKAAPVRKPRRSQA